LSLVSLYNVCCAVQKLYNEAKDHKLPMEVLNRYGGKFIKEVKVNLCLSHVHFELQLQTTMDCVIDVCD